MTALWRGKGYLKEQNLNECSEREVRKALHGATNSMRERIFWGLKEKLAGLKDEPFKVSRGKKVAGRPFLWNWENGFTAFRRERAGV